jgi:thioredoxin reductase
VVPELHIDDSNGYQQESEESNVYQYCAQDALMVPAAAVFAFIGADPCTDWLDGAPVTDDDGFILTGRGSSWRISTQPRAVASPRT